MEVRADLDEVAAALWHYDSRMNYEISGDVERKVEADGTSSEGHFEATIKRRQKLEIKRFAHHRARIFKSKIQMHRIGEKCCHRILTGYKIHQLLLLTLALTQTP